MNNTFVISAKAGLAVATLLVATSAFAQQPAPAARPAGAPAQQPPGPDAVFNAWDKNKDGALSKQEFSDGWALARDELAVQRLHQEFQRRDANKSGRIEADEYAKLAIVQRAGKSAPALSAFDKNKDGGLDFPEYLDFVRTGMKALQATPAPAPAARK